MIIKYYWNKIVCLYYLIFTKSIIPINDKLHYYNNFNVTYGHTGLCSWLNLQTHRVIDIYSYKVFRKCFPELYFYKPKPLLNKGPFYFSQYWFNIGEKEPRRIVIEKAIKLLRKYKKV